MGTWFRFLYNLLFKLFFAWLTRLAGLYLPALGSSPRLGRISVNGRKLQLLSLLGEGDDALYQGAQRAERTAPRQAGGSALRGMVGCGVDCGAFFSSTAELLMKTASFTVC